MRAVTRRLPKPSTFSIVAADATTGEVGVAVASKFLSVGAIAPFARAGAGAISTQAFANTSYGPRALDLLAAGASPAEVAAILVRDDEGRDARQFGIVSVREGAEGATYTGEHCIEWAGGTSGTSFAAQGNCLTGEAVIEALAAAIGKPGTTLADRLLAALAAGDEAGGDKRGRQSAALVVEKPKGGYAGFNDRHVDLRVDDHPAPVGELSRLLDLHALYFFEAEPEDVVAIDAAVGAQILRELKRIGAIDMRRDTYDEWTHAALVKVMHVENLENRVREDNTIDRQTLDYLRRMPSV